MSDFSRYDRQIKLPEVGREGQEKLKNSRVLIVGAGGLGCPAAQYLVGAGVGTIGLIDHDLVDKTNLHRQVLYTEANIGEPKAHAAKNSLEQLNSQITIVAHNEKLTEVNALALFEDYDVILDGTDNFQTKYLINDACVLSDKVFVGASIYKYQGQLSVFNYQKGPTYRCLYPTQQINDNSNCEESGVLGVLPGIMGSMQASEVLKIILEIGTVLSGKLKIFDTLTMDSQMISFKRNQDQIDLVKNRPLQLEAIRCTLVEKGVIYLDVREPYEQPRPEHKRLINIPLGELEQRHSEVPKTEEVHVFCQSGIRSKKAISILAKEYGFTNLVDVEGGIETIQE
jgi:adenylyltransferase/sulfurtransferase